MIKSLEYRDVKKWVFKEISRRYKVLIKNNKEILINADESGNMYKLSDENYKKYLVKNITKACKKSNKARVNSINKDTKNWPKN